MNKMPIKKLLLSCIVLLSFTGVFAQPLIADKIIAQVGEKIILRSEVETIYLQESSNGAGCLRMCVAILLKN